MSEKTRFLILSEAGDDCTYSATVFSKAVCDSKETLEKRLYAGFREFAAKRAVLVEKERKLHQKILKMKTSALPKTEIYSLFEEKTNLLKEIEELDKQALPSSDIVFSDFEFNKIAKSTHWFRILSIDEYFEEIS